MAAGKKALVLHPRDNVGVALSDIEAGESVLVTESDGRQYEFTVAEAVSFGHKFALSALEAESPVRKYGEEIGRLSAPVSPGGWIHVHNMYCDRGMK
jgi:hypothetical protein